MKAFDTHPYGMNPIDVQNGIQEFVQGAVKWIKNNCVEEIKDNPQRVLQIATVSANWDKEIGKTVSDAINAVGIDGAVHVEDSKSYDTSLRIVDGIQFERGYLSPYFVNNNEKQICEMDDAYVLLYKGALRKFNELKPILSEVKKNGKNLVVVADDLDPDVLQSLVVNKLKVGLNVVALKAPWFAEMRINTMEDLSIYMNTKYFDPMDVDSDLDLVSLEDLRKV